MNYRRLHDRLITRARNRPLRGYREVHHIRPKCLGGTDAPENLVSLTYREHFLIHWLLTKIYYGNQRWKLLFALVRMTVIIGERDVLSWQMRVVGRARKHATDLKIVEEALGNGITLLRSTREHNVRRHLTRTIRFSPEIFVDGLSRHERQDKLNSMATLFLRFSPSQKP